MAFDFIFTQSFFSTVLFQALALLPLLLYASLGEIVAEKSGVVNLGIEGMMLMAAFSSFTFDYVTKNPFAGVVGSLGVVAVMGLAFCFMTITLKVDDQTAYGLIGLSLLIATPFFVVFGGLSDRIGRLRIILFGCFIAAATYFWLFALLLHYANPALEAYRDKTPITVSAKD